MKVTDEMVERACAAYKAGFQGNPQPRRIRKALEAALADVPDQHDIAVELTDALMRANSAEAKLAKIRRLADSRPVRDEYLYRILDKE
jgi:hypothetical protein